MTTLTPEQIIEHVKALHHFEYTLTGGYQPRCAECKGPHPCETYRTADGRPGWPAEPKPLTADQPQEGVK